MGSHTEVLRTMEQGIAHRPMGPAPRSGRRTEADDDSARVQEIANRLGAEFTDVDLERLHQLVAKAFNAYSAAPVRDFIAVFVERSVRTELRGGWSRGRSEARS
jgi:predicted GNAT superfamily acetyltransferase